MNNRQITKIEIKGFKSIEECSLELGMVNILIGSNGSGKTNFISLFRMLQNLIDGELQAYISKHGGPNAFLFFGSKKTERIVAAFYFGENGYQFVLAPTADNRMMFERESFYWDGCGSKLVGSGHFESKWETGCGYRIDKFVKPILQNQKWRVYHFHVFLCPAIDQGGGFRSRPKGGAGRIHGGVAAAHHGHMAQRHVFSDL